MNDKQVGLTKDAGWELGVRTTVAAPIPVVWQYLMGEGLRVWLGDIDELPTEKGAAYATADGVTGTVRGYKAESKLRISWHPDDWPHDSILQLTVKESVRNHDRYPSRAARGSRGAQAHAGPLEEHRRGVRRPLRSLGTVSRIPGGEFAIGH